MAILFCLIPATLYAQRVLVVTTEQYLPEQWAKPDYNGEYIITDLVGAGLPFDVVTYGRFVNMDLGDHDVIFLSGHTSPTTVSAVFEKCQAVLSEGRKIFINGNLPHIRFSTDGTIEEYNRYVLDLFNVQDGGTEWLSGTPTVPPQMKRSGSYCGFIAFNPVQHISFYRST